jgi:hypothetical protein
VSQTGEGLKLLCYLVESVALLRGLERSSVTKIRGPRFRGPRAHPGEAISERWSPKVTSVWPGWCHGSAGHALLWATAASVLADSRFRAVAVAAGESVWGRHEASSGSLCCGFAGQALALFELARLTGDGHWVDRGRELARRATLSQVEASVPHSLFRGSVGVHLAAAEAITPDTSSWPFCRGML